MYRYRVERMKATIRCRLGSTLSTIQTLNHWNISLKIPAIKEMQTDCTLGYFLLCVVIDSMTQIPTIEWLLFVPGKLFLFRHYYIYHLHWLRTCCWRVCWCWPRWPSPWSDCWTSASSPSCCYWGRQRRISGSRSCSWGGGRLQPPRGRSWAGWCRCSGGQSICSDCWFSQNSK